MASFLLRRKKYMYYNEGGFLKMEINKKILVGSIGAAIVVIAGGVYANIRVIKELKREQDVIFEILHDSLCIDKAQSKINYALRDMIRLVNKKVDSLEKSNKK